jgi:SAM-dependent methyltransferase
MTQTPAQTRSPHFHHEATASTYRDLHLPRVFAPWARVLLEIAPAQAGEAVLDVATGPGTVARQAALLVGPTGRVVGVDVSAAMLGVARSWPAEAGAATIEYIESSATGMPLEDAAFDAAYCQQGLQHMSDPMQALAEIYRSLKPGGRLAVAIWQQSPFGLFREAVAKLALSEPGAQPSPFGRDPDDLAAALQSAGFGDVRVQQREMVSILTGGVPEAIDLAMATSASAGMANLSPAQKEDVRRALEEVITPRLEDDGVHLKSVTNIATALKEVRQ